MEGESKLINKFYPWTIDVDTNATKKLYQERNFATDQTANQHFLESITEKTKSLF